MHEYNRKLKSQAEKRRKEIRACVKILKRDNPGITMETIAYRLGFHRSRLYQILNGRE